MQSIHFNMAFVTKLLVVLLVTFDQQEISEAKIKIKKLIPHFGSVKDIVMSAKAVADVCDYLNEELHHIDSAYQQDQLEEKLDSVNLRFDTVRSDISFLQTGVFTKLEEKDKFKDLNKKMNELGKKIAKVDFLYEQLLVEINPETVHEIDVSNSLINDFINSADGITWRLTEIHNLLLRSHDNRYILNSLADQTLATKLICQSSQSSQQMIYNVYKRIVLAEIKGFVMLQWAYGKLSENSKKNSTHVQEAASNLIRRLSATLIKVKDQMRKTPRDLYKCDPDVGKLWVKGEHYENFGILLQKYMMYSSEGNNEAYKCDKCSTFKAVKPSCFTNLCEQTKYSDYACRGTARNCEAVHKKLSICKSNERHRKYEYIETGEGVKLGRKISCPNTPFEAESELLMNFKRCDYCLCTCENEYNESIRYFDTREVTSDIENNKVITGAQLVTKKDVFYIKIWQGELISDGDVNETEEKNIVELKLPHHENVLENFFGQFLSGEKPPAVDTRMAREGHEYYYLKWENRTFCLDNLYAPPNHILTGLKFEPENDHIKLAIRVTPFEFATGKLQKERSRWISNGGATLGSRNELILENRDVPILTHDDILDSKSNQYLKLETTGLEQDAGQNVVPFVDIQPVTARNPTAPFAGAGLMHKGPRDRRNGGFLALKLITYDFTPHMVLDFDPESSV